jgi:hypothetical protein
MAPIIPIALAGVVLALLASKKSDALDTGIRTPIGPVNAVKGRSGLTWETQMVEAPLKPLSEGGSATIQVILNIPAARRHMVIEYLQTGVDKTTPGGLVKAKRTLVRKGPSTPGLIQSAIADFGVTGPAAEAAAAGK